MARRPKAVRATVLWDLASGGADGSPVHLLFLASRCADKILASELRSSALTPRQYAVLVTAQNQAITQAGIANRLGLAGTTAAGIVRRLGEQGLLSREPAHEGPGIRLIRLTGAGRQAINTINALATRADNRIVVAVPVRRRRQFVIDLAVLVKLHRAALTGRT